MCTTAKATTLQKHRLALIELVPFTRVKSVTVPQKAQSWKFEVQERTKYITRVVFGPNIQHTDP